MVGFWLVWASVVLEVSFCEKLASVSSQHVSFPGFSYSVLSEHPPSDYRQSAHSNEKNDYAKRLLMSYFDEKRPHPPFSKHRSSSSNIDSSRTPKEPSSKSFRKLSQGSRAEIVQSAHRQSVYFPADVQRHSSANDIYQSPVEFRSNGDRNTHSVNANSAFTDLHANFVDYQGVNVDRGSHGGPSTGDNFRQYHVKPSREQVSDSQRYRYTQPQTTQQTYPKSNKITSPPDDYLPPTAVTYPPNDYIPPTKPTSPPDDYLPPQKVTSPPDDYLPPSKVTSPPEYYIPPAKTTSPPGEYIPPVKVTSPPEDYLPPLKATSPPRDYVLPGKVTSPFENYIPPAEITSPPDKYNPPAEFTNRPEEYLPPPIVTSPPEDYLPPLKVTSPPEDYLPPLKVTSPPEDYLPPAKLTNRPQDYIPPAKVTSPPDDYLPPVKTVYPHQNYTPQAKVTSPPYDYIPPKKVTSPPDNYIPPNRVTSPPKDYIPPSKNISPTHEYIPPNKFTYPSHDYNPPIKVTAPPDNYLPPTAVTSPPKYPLTPGEITPPNHHYGQPVLADGYLPPTHEKQFDLQRSPNYHQQYSSSSGAAPAPNSINYQGSRHKFAVESSPLRGSQQTGPCSEHVCGRYERCQMTSVTCTALDDKNCGTSSTPRLFPRCVPASHPTCHRCALGSICVLETQCHGPWSTRTVEKCPASMQCRPLWLFQPSAHKHSV